VVPEVSKETVDFIFRVNQDLGLLDPEDKSSTFFYKAEVLAP
jgi:hypothetical protein